MDFLTILQILDSSVRLATPLLLACLAGLYSERAGISNCNSAPPW
jgi:simple sugar transport system permease protein